MLTRLLLFRSLSIGAEAKNGHQIRHSCNEPIFYHNFVNIVAMQFITNLRSFQQNRHQTGRQGALDIDSAIADEPDILTRLDTTARQSHM